MSDRFRHLAEEHTSLIRKVINQIGLRLPPYVQREDLVGVAALGLLDAADRFDPSRGTDFATYAEHRIRGAVLDELRNRDPMPRVLRGKAKKIERTVDRLTHGLGRTPDDDEVAEALGIGLSKYNEIRLLMEHAGTVSFHETMPQSPGPTSGSFPNVAAEPGGPIGLSAINPAEKKADSGEFGPLQDLMYKEQVITLARVISELIRATSSFCPSTTRRT